MKLIKTEAAVGQVLCHDITQIVRGVVKDAVFRKGHVVRAEDIPVLLRVGKEHLYVWERDENMLHEDEAAEILRQICQGKHMSASAPKEGKIELRADMDGLFLADVERLRAVNGLGEMMIATRPSGFPVKKGDKLCGTRVIPLLIEREKMERARRAAGEAPLLRLAPMTPKKYGLVTTGSEVFRGRIPDTFTPVVREKMAEHGCEMAVHRILDDDPAAITAAILDMLDGGCELVLCTGGDERGPGRPHPPGHQEHRGPDRELRRAGAPRGHVPGGVHGGRAARVRPARLRDVRPADHLRPGPAPAAGGRAHPGGVAGGAGPRRAVPGL